MFVRIVLAIFIVLHGLVHLLYFGHSRRFFELQPGLSWPDGSWAFGRLPGVDWARWLAGGACVLAALGFVAGGSAVLAGWSWWRPVVVGAAAFSTAIWILFWNCPHAWLLSQRERGTALTAGPAPSGRGKLRPVLADRRKAAAGPGPQ